jgi:hypothetical protein
MLLLLLLLQVLLPAKNNRRVQQHRWHGRSRCLGPCRRQLASKLGKPTQNMMRWLGHALHAYSFAACMTLAEDRRGVGGALRGCWLSDTYVLLVCLRSVCTVWVKQMLHMLHAA